MAQYTVEAFRWSGTGYNAQYNTSYTAILDDNDANYEGGSDADETISINGGAFGATASVPYVIDVSFTDTLGNPHVESFYFFNTGGNWYFVPEPGSAFTVGATLGSYQSHTTGWQYSDVACFVGGTMITTDCGLVDVADLRPGSRVQTMDGTFQPVRLVLSRKIEPYELGENPKLRPVRISAGALGEFLPKRDLLISRQHRMVCNSPVTRRMFDAETAFVAAARLLDLPGVYVDDDIREVTYFHLVFEDHQVVLAEGALSESFLVCEKTITDLTPDSQAELFAIFPKLKRAKQYAKPAVTLPSRKRQKQLIYRIAKNNKFVQNHA